jgi:hypothetical protein
VPVVPLSVSRHGLPIPVREPAGGSLNVHRPQFWCLLEVPGFLMPRDAVIDTGSPLVIFPRAIWVHCQEGRDYEWLPFDGPTPPPGRVLGWQFTFRIARFLVPLAVMDTQLTTSVPRPGVIAAFAGGDPPASPGRKALPPVIVGLWGGVLEASRIAVERDPAAGVTGELHYP